MPPCDQPDGPSVRATNAALLDELTTDFAPLHTAEEIMRIAR